VAQRKRKGQATKTSGGNGMFYGVLAVIALAGIATIGYALMGGSGGAAANELVQLDLPDARAIYEQATPVTLGAADAPVKIVEFGDFQCPACGTFSLRIRPFVVDRYVNTGKAQFVFYDFPLVSIHDNAVLSARAARCAGEQELATPPALQNVPGELNAAYWVYHDKLYEEQSTWAYAQGSVVDEFVEYAAEVGLDEGAFEQCLKSDRFADVVTANRMLGEQLRLSGTPTVIINNRRVDAGTEAIAAAVEEALGTAAPATDSATATDTATGDTDG
jgi:protein-disulfide isomerase